MEPDALHARLVAVVEARRELAMLASPGPWKLNAEHDEVLAVDDEVAATAFALSNEQLRNTARHIAANDPPTVIRHCDADLRRLERHKSRPFPHMGVLCKGCSTVGGVVLHFVDMAGCFELRDIERAYCTCAWADVSTFVDLTAVRGWVRGRLDPTCPVHGRRE